MSDGTKAFTGKLEPEDVNYIPLSVTRGKACANCRWFIAGAYPSNACFIVDASDADDEPILATGYCDRWEAPAVAQADPIDQLAEALTEAIEDSGAMISGSLLQTAYNSIDEKPQTKTLKQRFGEILRLNSAPPKMKSFRVFKDHEGVYHWHAIHTNNFIDREKEIITEAAHDAYIERVDSGLVPPPLLMAWHTPGTEHGQADQVWRSGNFIHSVGHFFDTPLAKSAIKFYEKHADDLKMSHGFEHPDWAFDGKHYNVYNTFEVTTLPAFAAANPYTAFEEILNMAKEMSDEKKKYLTGLFGAKGFQSILDSSEQAAKALQEQGVEFKDYANPSAPATSTDPQTEQQKELSLAQTISDLHGLVTETISVVALQGKAIKAKDVEIAALKTELKSVGATHEAETKAWQKALDEIRQQVNLPVERASESTSTVTEIKSEDAKDNLPDAEAKTGLAMFGAKMRQIPVS